jgi:hypothetical protein
LSVFRPAGAPAAPCKFSGAVDVWLTRKITRPGEMVLHFQIGPFDDVPSHNRRGASVVDDFFDHSNISSCFVAPMDAVQPILVDNHNSIDIDVFVKFNVPDILMVDHGPGSPITSTVVHFVGRYRNPADIAAAVNPRDARGIPRYVPPSARYRRPPVPTVIVMDPAAVMMSYPTKALVGDPQLLARPIRSLTNRKRRPIECDVSRSPIMGGFTIIS